MLTGEQVQRLGSHIARNKPGLQRVLASAAGRVRQAFPSAGPAVDVSSASRRYAAAEAVASITKRLDDLESLRPWLVRCGAKFSAQGLDCAAVQALAGRAIFDAVRGVSGEDWDDAVERDYRALITFVMGAMAEGSARRLGAMRMAA
jgi:hypothetical protein